MKRLVVYESSTGFTKKYAEWIAKKLSCEVKPRIRVKAKEAAGYDQIIYGGWVLGGRVNGLDKFMKLYPGKLVVFAVGVTPDSETVRNNIVSASGLGTIPFFYMQGGLNPSRQTLIQKRMLKMVRKFLAAKKDKNNQDRLIEQLLGHQGDYTDVIYINPLVEYVKQQEGEEI